MHRTIDPTILYFGTPVALVSSMNEDATPNLAPMFSVGKNVSAIAFEVHIVKLHVDESLLVPGNSATRPHIDPARWRPLLMSFCRFFGMGDEVHPSRLAESKFLAEVIRA